MDENKTANVFDENLPPADLAAAMLILVLFVASMVFLVPMIPSQTVSAQVGPDLKLENLVEDSGETILLSSIKPKPSTSYEPSQKPSGKDFKIKGSRFKFPPFYGKKGEHIFHPIINKASKQHDIDPALVKAVIMAESSYNPRAVSPRGAVGLMQLMPNTAESLGVANSFNPEQNILGGTKYLKKLIDQFHGDIKLALAAYNAGPAHVKKHNGVPPFKETVHYVHKVYHYYDFYKNQDVIQARQEIKRNRNKMLDDVDEA
jgi:hypothetical protein